MKTWLKCTLSRRGFSSGTSNAIAAAFPDDFMIQLTMDEWDDLRSQFVFSKGRDGRRYAPYALTPSPLATTATQRYASFR